MGLRSTERGESQAVGDLQGVRRRRVRCPAEPMASHWHMSYWHISYGLESWHGSCGRAAVSAAPGELHHAELYPE